ncbi:epithelial membrane protein 2 [Rhincodon typus]|uniref:epithelial membrane protein 2 n=1 Tax=Rhincodon typus TaxID=259920 RepID=UPI0009A29637|nr:epithelial membrane protein 2 [Rhincodon typus]XP_048465581.1 epithelial membrane protein 2 [Rhincodon typus]
MLVLLGFILVFHIATAALLFIATIDNAWWKNDMVSTDIWMTCPNNGSQCDNVYVENYGDCIKAIQATMCLSVIFCCISFIVFVVQLFRLQKGQRFYIAGTLQLLSSLCVMIAASIYTNQQENFHGHLPIVTGNYGYSYILAWIAFAFTLISGVMYIVLRKRK